MIDMTCRIVSIVGTRLLELGHTYHHEACSVFHV